MNTALILLTLIAAAVGLAVGTSVLSLMRHVFVVAEGFAGLLYQHGVYVRRNNAGRHVIWGRGWTLQLVDLRKASLAIGGQEVLTSDRVSVKIGLQIAYQVIDPAKAVNASQNWYLDLHNAAQLALRKVLIGMSVDALLEQRAGLGAQLVAVLRPEADKIGLSVHSVELKDVMFSAELKRAFADVLKAKQEGQAALERARGESAALRNLANAARLLEGNPALQNLRLMQSIATSQGAGSTLVLGVPGGFVPVKQNGSSTEKPAHGEP
ncbi:MAG TPA: slipin family protein [Roseimicrobium sp.]|nr:slipin family protein [Roseimicrobium sp.]